MFLLLYHYIIVLKFKINKIIMDNEKLIDLATKILQIEMRGHFLNYSIF